MVMPLGGNTAGDARYAFSHTNSLLAPGYGAPAGRAAPTEQNGVMREGNTGLHAATMPTTSTQRAPMPRQGSALMANSFTVRSQFSAYREGLFAQMQGRDFLAAAGGSPARGERFHARWDASLETRNNIGGSRPVTLDAGSSDVARLRGYVVTPISIGSLAEVTQFAIPSSYATSPVVAREPAPAVTTTTTTTGQMMTSSSENSFQHHVKFDSPLSSGFEPTRNGPSRPPGLLVPPYSLDNAPQPQNEGKFGVTNNETYSSLMSYERNPSSSYHADPCMHALFPYCRQMPQNAIYSVAFRNAVNTTTPASNVLHTGSFSAGRGLPAPYHNTGMPPPPLSYQEQTQQQPRLYPRETAAEASDQAGNPPMRRTRQRQESTFWELFERLSYRPSGQTRRGATNTGTQRRTGQGHEGGNHSFGGWLRHSRRVAEYTRPIIPSFSPVRPRPGTPPPPPQTLSREAQSSRIALRFSSNHRPARLSELYLFEAAFAPDVDNMSYEELLELAERIGRVECGVSRERLQQLQVVLQPIHFGVTSSRQEKTGTARGSAPSPHDVQLILQAHEEESLTCCVCLDSFSVGNVATQLPCCRHFLHEDCSSRWFESQFRCPICTRDVRETED